MKDICVFASEGLLSWRNFTRSRLPQKLSYFRPLVYGRTKDRCLASAMEQKPGPAGTSFQRERLHLNIHEKRGKRGKTKNVKDDEQEETQTKKNVH